MRVSVYGLKQTPKTPDTLVMLISDANQYPAEAPRKALPMPPVNHCADNTLRLN